MISAWNLLWIIPIASLMGFAIFALTTTNSRDEEYSEAYNKGYIDGTKDALKKEG